MKIASLILMASLYWKKEKDKYHYRNFEDEDTKS